jgi:hypothetical protein
MRHYFLRASGIASLCIAVVIAVQYGLDDSSHIEANAQLTEQVGTRDAHNTRSVQTTWGSQSCNDAGMNPFASHLRCDPATHQQALGREEDKTIFPSVIDNALKGDTSLIAYYAVAYSDLCDVPIDKSHAKCDLAARAENDKRYLILAEDLARKGNLGAQLAMGKWWLEVANDALKAKPQSPELLAQIPKVDPGATVDSNQTNVLLTISLPDPNPAYQTPEFQKAFNFLAMAAPKDTEAARILEILQLTGLRQTAL